MPKPEGAATKFCVVPELFVIPVPLRVSVKPGTGCDCEAARTRSESDPIHYRIRRDRNGRRIRESESRRIG